MTAITVGSGRGEGGRTRFGAQRGKARLRQSFGRGRALGDAREDQWQRSALGEHAFDAAVGKRALEGGAVLGDDERELSAFNGRRADRAGGIALVNTVERRGRPFGDHEPQTQPLRAQIERAEPLAQEIGDSLRVGVGNPKACRGGGQEMGDG